MKTMTFRAIGNRDSGNMTARVIRSGDGYGYDFTDGKFKPTAQVQDGELPLKPDPAFGNIVATGQIAIDPAQFVDGEYVTCYRDADSTDSLYAYLEYFDVFAGNWYASPTDLALRIAGISVGGGHDLRGALLAIGQKLGAL